MTKKARMRDSAAVIDSTTPSAKCSCSGSADMLSNGRTAIEGLSGRSSGAAAVAAAAPAWRCGAAGSSGSAHAAGSQVTAKAWTGRSMFFRCRLPRSSKLAFMRPATASCTVREIRMPPGEASASSRAATLTPSPNRSSSSTIRSPRCRPMRRRMARSSGSSRAASCMTCCNSMAAVSASTAEPNSASTPSPVSLTMRPPRRATIGTTVCLRMARRRATVPLSSRPMSLE